MLDAWAKLPEGILSGHVNALGDFDECLAVRAQASERFQASFQGKYCLIYAMPNITGAGAPTKTKTGSGNNPNQLLKDSDRSPANLLVSQTSKYLHNY